jgi:hypothetical protein
MLSNAFMGFHYSRSETHMLWFTEIYSEKNVYHIRCPQVGT